MSAQLIGDDVLAAGYTCECGKYHKHPSYIYAHWREEIEHTCDGDGCRRIHLIVCGRAELLDKKAV